MGVYFADTGNKFKVWKRFSSLFQAAGRTARRPDSPAAGRPGGTGDVRERDQRAGAGFRWR